MLDGNTHPINDVQRLKVYIAEVIAALNSQAEILKMRGMNLPPGATQNLESIDRDLTALQKHMGGEDTELAQLRALAATSAMINSSLDLDDVLARAIDEVIALTGAERGYIVLRNSASGELDFRVSRDLETGQSSGFQGSQTILNDVIASGQPILSDNAYGDPRMQQVSTIAQMVLRSVLCVPLRYKDQITGAVYVDNRLRSGMFSDREKGVLSAFANQMAVAIENARLFMQAQAYLNDITEIQEVMGNVFSSIGSGVITTTQDDTIRTFNAAAGDILGLAPEIAIGQPLETVIPALKDDIINRIEQGESAAFEAEFEHAHRGRLVLGLKLSPLKDPEGQLQGVALVADDLTEQREREDRLNILRRYLPPAMVDNIEDIANLALGGERREMTCMFVDVRPFSTFPSELRPKQVMDLLNEYLAVATDCISDFNGVLDKYMGTEVMALFNTQINPQPDHSWQAVVAALEMRERFVELYARQGLDPTMHLYRVGIHSGVATTGNVGSINRRDFTALGDTINLSHRLLENAAGGQIIVSEANIGYIQHALGALPDHIHLQNHDPIKAKGRQQFTTVYEVFRT
jgi:PAS domain S-box-containing protein